MPQVKKTSQNQTIVGRPGARVKAQIIEAGIPLNRLAQKAGIKPSSLSNCLAGRRRCLATQEAIWLAFRGLAGSEAASTPEQFWGSLLNRKVA